MVLWCASRTVRVYPWNELGKLRPMNSKAACQAHDGFFQHARSAHACMWASGARPLPHLECHQLLSHLRRNDCVCASSLGVVNLRGALSAGADNAARVVAISGTSRTSLSLSPPVVPMTNGTPWRAYNCRAQLRTSAADSVLTQKTDNDSTCLCVRMNSVWVGVVNHDEVLRREQRQCSQSGALPRRAAQEALTGWRCFSSSSMAALYGFSSMSTPAQATCCPARVAVHKERPAQPSRSAGRSKAGS